MNYSAEQRRQTMNYAHCFPSAAFSPPGFFIFLGDGNETARGRANRRHAQSPHTSGFHSCPASFQPQQSWPHSAWQEPSRQVTAEPQSPTAAIVSGAQPASSPSSAARFDSGPSRCHRDKRLKGTKPSGPSGNEGTVQAQSGQLPALALRLAHPHTKVENSGSPFIKVLIGTDLHQIIFQPLASTCYLHAVSSVQLCWACLEWGTPREWHLGVSSY